MIRIVMNMGIAIYENRNWKLKAEIPVQ
jgi:hypothetical protein